MNQAGERLLKLLIAQELSADDKQWLLNYIENTDQNDLQQLLKSEYDQELNQEQDSDIDFPDQLLTDIYKKAGIKKPVTTPVISLRIKRLALAAVFATLILTFSVWIFNAKKNIAAQKGSIAMHRFNNDVAPGCKKAVLTLSGGKKVVLDSGSNGLIASQGNTRIIKAQNGKLVYNTYLASKREPLFNTITTPRGGQYEVTLSDGSVVWLNAASSIRFPTFFSGNERRVEITGEAYFEVAKNKQKPFVVNVNNSEVRVLGTHFNVNAYTDEESVKTTLLEGSVLFKALGSNCVLKPGEQSDFINNGQLKVIPHADVETAMAWKNGMLHFENVDITAVMRQLSRWYDIDVVYRAKTGDHFFLDLPAQSKLSDVLKMMELTGRVSFDIQKRSVIVN